MASKAVRGSRPGVEELTFVLEEIAHPRPPSQDKLGDILDNLPLLLRRECGEPFGEALRWGQSRLALDSGGYVFPGGHAQPCPASTAGSDI